MNVRRLFFFTLVQAFLTRAEPDQTLAYMYLDSVEYLAASNNVVPVLLSTLEEAFVQTKPADTARFSGYDWTQPYPGEQVDGFDARLRIAYDVPLPDSLVQNSTSTVTALTFSNPPSMMGETNVTKPMDPSWFICQHLFVSDKPESTAAFDHTCGFLPPTCLQDLKSGLTEDWGKLDPTTPCPGQVFDAVPLSCQDALGVSRADVLAWDTTVLKDPAQADLLTIDQVSQYTWKIGTGYHDNGDPSAYAKASNRTYLVATAWGYSSDAPEASKQAPDASFACLQPALDLETPEDVKPNAVKSSSSKSLVTAPSMHITAGLAIAALSSS